MVVEVRTLCPNSVIVVHTQLVMACLDCATPEQCSFIAHLAPKVSPRQAMLLSDLHDMDRRKAEINSS